MVVCGHIGLTPQSSGQLGGFKAQGLRADSAIELIRMREPCRRLERPCCLWKPWRPKCARLVTSELTILFMESCWPLCGWPAPIVSDMLGIFQAYTSSLAKKYANLAEHMLKAIEEYVKEVKTPEVPCGRAYLQDDCWRKGKAWRTSCKRSVKNLSFC